MLLGMPGCQGDEAPRYSGLELYGASRHPPALPDSTAFEARSKTTGKNTYVLGRLGSEIKKARRVLA